MSEISIPLTSWVLPEDCGVERRPTRDPMLRHPDFEERYDARTVLFDLFRTEDENCWVGIGPPLNNLLADLEPRIVALPSGETCNFSVCHRINLDRLTLRVPPGTTHISVCTRVGDFELRPSEDFSEVFRDARAMMTLQKDNDLVWIRDWALYHARVHGARVAVVYDNGSSRYSTSDIAAALSTIKELDHYAVIDWPFPYGPADYRRSSTIALVDGDYCQRGAFEHAANRLFPLAGGVLNADVDELVYSPSGANLYDLLDASDTGYLRTWGHWITAMQDDPRQKPRHLSFYRSDTGLNREAAFKWVVCPRRLPRGASWQIHEVVGADPSVESTELRFGHFRAISTNWDMHTVWSDELRTDIDPGRETVLAGTLRDAMVASLSDAPEITTPAPPPHALAPAIIEQEQSRKSDIVGQHHRTAAVSFQLRQLALFRDDSAESLRYALEAAKAAPGEMSFFRSAAIELLLEAQRYDEALELARNDRDDLPRLTRAHLLALEAVTLKRAGFDGALKAIDRAIALDGRRPGYHVFRAELLRVAGALNVAEAELRKAARLLDDKDAFERSIADRQAYCDAIGRHTPWVDPLQLLTTRRSLVWRRLAELLQQRRRFEEAAQAATSYVQGNQLDSSAHTMHARYLDKGNDKVGATKARLKALRVAEYIVDIQDITDPVKWLEIRRLDNKNWLTSPKVLLRQARQLHFLMWAQLELNQYHAALDSLKRAFVLAPTNVAPAWGLARALMQRGEPVLALEATERGLEACPDDVTCARWRVTALVALERFEEARNESMRVIGLAPDDWRARSDYGEVLTNLGRYEEAADCFARAAELAPGEMALVRDEVGALIAAGQHDNALATLDAAAGRFVDDFRIAFHRARVFEDARRYQDALIAVRRSLMLRPDFKPAQKMRKRLQSTLSQAP